jgi:hypothetical protein
MFEHLQDFVMSAFTSGSAQGLSHSDQHPPATTASTVDPAVQSDRNVPQSTVSLPQAPPGHPDPQPAQIKIPYAPASTAQVKVPLEALRRSPSNRDDILTRDFAKEADDESIVSSIDRTGRYPVEGDAASIDSLPGSFRRVSGAQRNPTMQTVPLAQPVQQQPGAIPQSQTAGYDTGSVNDPNMSYHEAGEPADVPGQTGYDGSSIGCTGRRPRRFPGNRGMHETEQPLDSRPYDDAGSNDRGSIFSEFQAEVASLKQSLESFRNSILLSLNSLNTRFDQMNSRLSEMTNALPGFTMSSNRSAAPPSSFQPAALQTADPSATVGTGGSIPQQVRFVDQQGQTGSVQPVPNPNASSAIVPEVQSDVLNRGSVENAPLIETDAMNTAQAVERSQAISGFEGTAPMTKRAKGRHFFSKRVDPKDE